MKYQCPCCGYYTYEVKPGGTDEICPVCFWEDDIIQLEDEEFFGGVKQARTNFAMFGACETEMKPYVREPFEDEKCE